MGKPEVYLRMMRPANIVTSVADVLAGVGLSGYFMSDSTLLFPVLMLCISTMGLYGGGIVFNDVFDADLDRIERPERAIPRGEISLNEAKTLGIVLLMIGLVAAFAVSAQSGLIAFLIAVFALIYDKFAKDYSFLGPLNMGICRGLNLLLGISILAASLQDLYFLGLVPLIYIFSITMISQGEVHGSGRGKLFLGAFLYLIVITALAYHSWTRGELMFSILFIILFAYGIYKPLFVAVREPIGKNIGKAVKAGVISLILMDAAWASASGFQMMACLIAALLPLSLLLAKRFAVT